MGQYESWSTITMEHNKFVDNSKNWFQVMAMTFLIGSGGSMSSVCMKILSYTNTSRVQLQVFKVAMLIKTAKYFVKKYTEYFSNNFSKNDDIYSLSKSNFTLWGVTNISVKNWKHLSTLPLNTYTPSGVHGRLDVMCSWNRSPRIGSDCSISWNSPRHRRDDHVCPKGHHGQWRRILRWWVYLLNSHVFRD